MSIRTPPDRTRGAHARIVIACMAARRGIGKLARDRRGAAAVEYGLVATLVVLAILAAILELGRTNLDVWTNVAAKVTAA